MAELLVDLVVYVLLPSFVAAVVVQTIQLLLFSSKSRRPITAASQIAIRALAPPPGNEFESRSQFEWFTQAALSGSIAAITGLFVGNLVRETFPWKPNEAVWSAGLYCLMGVMVVELVIAACGGVQFPRGARVALQVLLMIVASAGLVVVVTPTDLRATPWPRVLLATVISAGWIGGHWLRSQTGERWSTAIVLVGSCLGLGGVLIHAGMARFMDAAMSVAAATSGAFLAFVFHHWWSRSGRVNAGQAVEAVGATTQSNSSQSNSSPSSIGQSSIGQSSDQDTSSFAGLAVGPVAAFVPIIALVGHNESYSNVPWYSFALVGMAPFTMLLSMVLPRWLKPFWAAAITVILAAVVSAAGLGFAAWFEPLAAH